MLDGNKIYHIFPFPYTEKQNTRRCTDSSVTCCEYLGILSHEGKDFFLSKPLNLGIIVMMWGFNSKILAVAVGQFIQDGRLVEIGKKTTLSVVLIPLVFLPCLLL